MGCSYAAVTLIAGTYTFVAQRLLRTGLSRPAAVFLLLLVMAASSYHFIPRPHLITIALTTWTFALLNDVESGRVRLWRLGCCRRSLLCGRIPTAAPWAASAWWWRCL